MVTRFVLLVLFFLSGCSTVSFGPSNRGPNAVYGKDDRYIVDPSISPWKSLGRLNVNGYVCTASLIQSCYILTANHCFDTPNDATSLSQPSLPSSEVTFQYGQRLPIVAKKVLSPRGYSNGKHSLDWALAKLEQLVPPEIEPLIVVDGKVDQLFPNWWTELWSSKKKYVIAGYNGDIERSKVLTADPNVEIVRFNEKKQTLEYRADTFTGSSGAPILRIDSNGRAEIVGLNVSAFLHTEKHLFGEYQGQVYLAENESKALAEGIPSERFYDEISHFISTHPCQ